MLGGLAVSSDVNREFFVPRELIARTGKAELVVGCMKGRAAVLKRLVNDGALWNRLFAREIEMYEHFQSFPPPVSVPKLLWASADDAVLVLEHVPGVALAHERYPRSPIDGAVLMRLLTELERLHSWETEYPRSLRAVDQFLEERICKAKQRGFISEVHVRRIGRIIADNSWKPEFNHGDLVLSNCLLADRRVTFVDWEFGDCYLPGYDLAMLWTLLGEQPAGRRRIEIALREVGDTRLQLFTVNQVLVLTRELKIYQELGAAATNRLGKLESDLSRVLRRLEQLAR